LKAGCPPGQALAKASRSAFSQSRAVSAKSCAPPRKTVRGAFYVKFADIMPLVMIRAGQAGHRTVAGRIEALTPLKTEPWREAILIGGWSYSPVVLRCPGTAGCELSPQTSRDLLGGGGCLLPAPMGLNNLDIRGLARWQTLRLARYIELNLDGQILQNDLAKQG
jgi:hypothetical protein